MQFGLFQGLVQILMNRYQIGRLYNLVARGKATRMDVTAEIMDQRFAVSMGVLLPFLIGMNCYQLYIGYAMLSHTHMMYPHTEWQAATLGALFLVFAGGNIWTTLGSSIKKLLQPVPSEPEE